MKIYTKIGDQGLTRLASGRECSKNSPIVECYGTIDELNSWMGLIISNIPLNQEDDLKEYLYWIQNKLFDLGSQIAAGDDETRSRLPNISEEDVYTVEKHIDSIQSEIPELRNFVLPGGDPVASQFHVARTVCRRAERLLPEVSGIYSWNEEIPKFINRLSDDLFVTARYMNFKKGHPETIWSAKKL